MQKGQAFFVVGHENWGKSKTLKALTGTHQIRWHEINGRQFFIRRMSNDDRPDEWAEALESFGIATRSHLILTACPKPAAYAVMRRLGSNYDLYFWVILHSHDGSRSITEEELRSLGELGTVESYSQRGEPAARAAALERFIRSHP